MIVSFRTSPSRVTRLSHVVGVRRRVVHRVVIGRSSWKVRMGAVGSIRMVNGLTESPRVHTAGANHTITSFSVTMGHGCAAPRNRRERLAS